MLFRSALLALFPAAQLVPRAMIPHSLHALPKRGKKNPVYASAAVVIAARRSRPPCGGALDRRAPEERLSNESLLQSVKSATGTLTLSPGPRKVQPAGRRKPQVGDVRRCRTVMPVFQGNYWDHLTRTPHMPWPIFAAEISERSCRRFQVSKQALGGFGTTRLNSSFCHYSPRRHPANVSRGFRLLICM